MSSTQLSVVKSEQVRTRGNLLRFWLRLCLVQSRRCTAVLDKSMSSSPGGSSSGRVGGLPARVEVVGTDMRPVLGWWEACGAGAGVVDAAMPADERL